MNVGCNYILKKHDLDDNNYASNYLKAVTLKDMQTSFGHMYIGSKETIITDKLFIVSNIHVNEQMEAS